MRIDELAVGWCAKPVALAIEDIDRDGKLVAKHTVDAERMATEDLAVADLNSDKRPEIIASGPTTRNAKICCQER